MAVARVYQREIVEVPFTLPDGKIHPELTIPIQSEWLSSPMARQSFFVTHIVSPFNVDDVFAHRNCFLRHPYFDDVVNRIIANIVDGAWQD